MQQYPTLLPLFMIVKFFLFQNHLKEPFHGGISSNTSIHLTLFSIQTTPSAYQNNLGKLLPHFLKLYGYDFNFITTGFSTRGGGVAFSRNSINQIDWHSLSSLSIENPQEPGTFLGNNCFQATDFHNACFSAYQNLMSEGRNEQSMLLRIFRRPEWIIQHRNELHRQYQSLIGETVESFSLHPQITLRHERSDRQSDRNGRQYDRNDRQYERNDRQYDRNDRQYDRYKNDRNGSDRKRNSSQRDYNRSERSRPYMH